jgi:hypothetical protein
MTTKETKGKKEKARDKVDKQTREVLITEQGRMEEAVTNSPTLTDTSMEDNDINTFKSVIHYFSPFHSKFQLKKRGLK